MASGEAEAILLKATATARGIDAVAQAIREGKDSAQNAVSLTVADKYIEAFGQLAKQGTAVVVPGNVGDMGGMIASAMAVYGKVNESQKRNLRLHNADEQSADAERREVEAVEQDNKNDMAKTVLEGFDKTRNARN